ncbi:PREDICTED: LOW QUALITY PROTEIN: lisH domain-containing protein ARMC9 [Atta colombica]|uniref:LOW QUALITY PROTEIN: lisH domain-containing protein ARMC9 n=1 Tax=Atta colombica TaxID=520822 RepID=UPI00084CAAB5|nr:PREDICTED: LOW QUALITY PROTEIN: lisH domain-containing protein ARMC9 [Atta colombica]
MSNDEEVIRRRLLIDGDGTGDDRRINMLLKSFIKWINSSDVDNTLHERMLSQLAQCEFAQKKSRLVSNMSREELKSYEKLSKEIEVQIEKAKEDIEKTKAELQDAKRVRKNRIEYDVLAKVINEQPDRLETHIKLETLQQELGALKFYSGLFIIMILLGRIDIYVITELCPKNQMADKNIEVIHKFLLDHNFESTAEALIQEALKMGFQTLKHKLGKVIDPYVQLMLCYNMGDYSTFFQDLSNLDNINSNKTQLQNLVQVHTMPVTKTIAMESGVAQNKTIKNNIPIVPNDRDLPIFLDNDEEQYYFSKTSLKSKSTQTHIIGSQIIINNLREDIINPEESVSNLLKMHKSDKRLIQYDRELVVTKSRLCSIHTNYEKLKVRFHKLHADYHKLIDVARELTMALENSVKGQNIDIQRTLEICMKIFPDLFNQNIRETSYPSLLQLDRINVKAITLPKLDVTAVPVSPKLLDYKKIKLHLISGDVKTKLLLLQALRWKITLMQSAEQDEILHEYISRDLLGLHGQIASDNGKSILPCLLTAGEAYARHLLQQFTARLLNTLASFRCGRDYLSVGSSVINVTFACLDNNYADGVDPFACDMMVAMLQKLSLRRQQRIYMIESGLLEWLINHLHDKCRIISLYRLEYATALLMNLSLHRLAQARASKISSLLMSTLIVLLSINYTSSLPYINGALNNFLNNPVINEEAKKIKRSNISEYLGNNQKSAEIRKHLDHVLRIQRCENVNTPQNDETGDDDNEDLDVLESELDENDPLQNYIGELNGETLLAMCYSISSKISQETVNTDTTLQQISTLNSIDFYGNQHKNHVCNKHPSYPTLRDSSETVVTSSTILVPDRENGQAEIQEKFSSIASLNSNNCNSNIINDTSWKDDPELAKEEEAFLAKPKLSRTPP